MKNSTKLQDKYKKFVIPAVLATILYIVELNIPKPLPWFRLGLTNIVTLVLISFEWSLKDIFIIIIVRVLTASIIGGTILTHVFFMSLSASLASFIVMFYVYRFFKRYISLLTASVFGSMVNITVQICLASLLLLNNFSLLTSLPLFLIYSLLAGSLTGYFSIITFNYINEKSEQD